MSGHILDEDCNYSQLIDSDDNLSILEVFEMNTSLNRTKYNEPTSDGGSVGNQPTSENKSLNDTCLGDFKGSRVNWFSNDPKKFYYDHIKPSCPELECSYSEIFAETRPKREEELRALAAARINQIVESVKNERLNKSFSCPNLQKLVTRDFDEEDSLQTTSQHFNFQNNNTSFKSCDTINLNLSNLPNTDKGTTINRFVSGSVDGLNHSHFNESYTLSSKCYDGWTDTHVNTTLTSHRLQKSYSSSCLPDRNDSLMDIELKLEDSVPSEDEVDEMGLPVKKFFYNNTPSKKKDDISKIIVKYRNLRASLGEPNVQNDVETKRSDNTAREPLPLLPEISDTQLKKSQATTSKGPLKAIMPIQNMTKLMGVKITSPFKKKKDKKT